MFLSIKSTGIRSVALTRISKQQYYFTFFDANLTYMKKTWEGINNITGRKSTNAKAVDLIKNSKV